MVPPVGKAGTQQAVEKYAAAYKDATVKVSWKPGDYDHAHHQRGRAVGVYYGIRNLLVVPAGVVGGLLYQRSPALPLETASVVGAIGTLAFAWASRRGPAASEPR